MENTIELIHQQTRVLQITIQWLDRNKHSNKPIRGLIDCILNHSQDLVKKSEMELTKITYKGKED